MIPLHPIVFIALLFLAMASMAEVLDKVAKATVNFVLKVACKIDGVEECTLHE